MDTVALTTIFLNIWLWAGIGIGSIVLLFLAAFVVAIIVGIIFAIRN